MYLYIGDHDDAKNVITYNTRTLYKTRQQKSITIKTYDFTQSLALCEALCAKTSAVSDSNPSKNQANNIHLFKTRNAKIIAEESGSRNKINPKAT